MTNRVIKKSAESFNSFKKGLAISLMVLFYIQMWGSNGPGFIEGTQLYVMANSGLILRLGPSMNSESLGVVQFGSTVEVLNQPDSIQNVEKLNWVEGKWIFVEHDGVTGYMFDGYLSDLPLPIYDFEKCQLDLDLVYPLESWVDVNLGENESVTVEAGALKKVTDTYFGGEKLVRTHKNGQYKAELYLKDVRLMDAYHLLQSMIDSKARLEIFKEKSTFIEDEEGDLHKVKINLDNPIELIKLKSGEIKIIIRSDNYMCSL